MSELTNTPVPNESGTLGDPANSGTPNPNESGDGQSETTYATWAEYEAAHPEAKALHEADKAAVHSALEKEREKAKTASSQLRELAKTADPATAQQLRDAADAKDAENAELKKHLDFQTAAMSADMLGSAVEKAWVLAQGSGLTIDQMKADPDLKHWFREAQTPSAPPNPRVNGGSGAGTPPGQTPNDFNANLRARMGVKSQ